MPRKPEPEKRPPPKDDEWKEWKEFALAAKDLAEAIKCDFNTALLLLGLNEIVQQLQNPDDDEPWRGGKHGRTD